MINTLFYPYLKKKFYCEYLWFRVSILQDGRMEPCSCAISHMEPLSTIDSSIQSVWNNHIFTKTREFLIGKMSSSGEIPKKDPDIFDCCISCPVAPKQRHQIPTVYYSIIRDSFRNNFIKSPMMIIKKLNNLRNLITNINNRCVKIDAYPAYANIDPANICNLKCLECNVGSGEHKPLKGQMTLDLYYKIMNEIGLYLLYIEFCRYGEPLLNKNILEMIELASRKYRAITMISTNFAMPLSIEFLRGLVSSGLSIIVIAADDIDQGFYKKYRVGGNVNTVIENLKNLIKIKKEMNSKTPNITWQSLIFSFNENRKKIIEKYIRDLGVNSLAFIPAYLSPKNYHLRPKSTSTRGGRKDKKSQILHATATPAVINKGETFNIKIEVIQNAFKEAIPASPEKEGIRVGIKLADENKREISDFERVLFDKPLEPGEKVVLTKKIISYPKIESVEKIAYLKIDLLMEHRFWFEQNMEIQSVPYFMKIEFRN